MTITMRGLLEADLAGLRAVADRWEHLVRDIDGTVADLTAGTKDLPHHWTGPAGQAAHERSIRLQVQVGNANVHCDSIRYAISRLADQLEEYQRRLNSVLNQAITVGLHVDEERGRVHIPYDAVPAASVSGGIELAAGPTVNSYQLQIEEILSLANVADRDAAAVLAKHQMGETELPETELEPIHEDIVLATLFYSPDSRAQWWYAQHQLNRDRLTAEYPEVIGSGEGLPTGARDAANRLLLSRTRNELLARQAATPDEAAGQAAVNADRTLSDIADIERRLAEDPDARLLNHYPPTIGKPDPRWDNYPD
ncbi:WXG100 family type VII secretion target [Paractinoplanes rishiriensis]|uniref:Uncharacterized protein n=1 Tax=Paractinoplanes rishiriensis TaxID=1050105 RepID=A0A919JXX8_9ACTN|nr:hypothetical protein [Actinoplanes rishiriensis]GIE92996.1 hypothetical protein Ari01nite_04610 [Actinoplanes rishiriensis]